MRQWWWCYPWSICGRPQLFMPKVLLAIECSKGGPLIEVQERGTPAWKYMALWSVLRSREWSESCWKRHEWFPGGRSKLLLRKIDSWIWRNSPGSSESVQPDGKGSYQLPTKVWKILLAWLVSLRGHVHTLFVSCNYKCVGALQASTTIQEIQTGLERYAVTCVVEDDTALFVQDLDWQVIVFGLDGTKSTKILELWQILKQMLNLGQGQHRTQQGGTWKLAGSAIDIGPACCDS